MNWFFLSLACAFFTATTAALSKIILKKKDEFFLLWITYAFSLPIFLLVLSYQPRPQLTLDFWKIVVFLIPLETLAFLAYLKALKLSPLSLVFPFLGLTPVFTILTSSIILKEKLLPFGIGGVILVSMGAYLLNADTIKNGGMLAPIKNIYREKGVMLMISVAFIFSFSSVLGKKAILLSSPETFPAIYYSVFFAVLTPFAYLKARRSRLRQGFGGQAGITVERKDILLFLALGALFGTTILLQSKAILLVNVSYMISVKRLSLVISVLYGAIVFKERNIGFRLLGSAVMLVGVLILLLMR